MFFYAVLLFAFFHLFALSRMLRRGPADENTKVLMYLSLVVALSVPLLGLLHAQTATALLLAASLPLYRYRRRVMAYLKFPGAVWLKRYGRLRPYPCLAVSIFGLLSWAWYHP